MERRLTTDQGMPFRSRLSQAFFDEFHIEHRMTTSYHQQADGLAKRTNKTVMGMLRQHIVPLERQKDWSNFMQQHAMAYNTSIQASIGYEPFFLIHGFHAATAVEVVLPTPVAITGEEPVADSRDKALVVPETFGEGNGQQLRMDSVMTEIAELQARRR